MKQFFTVTGEGEASRLDAFLSAQLDGLSRSHIQKILKGGGVLVNGRPEKSSYRVAPGDQVELEVPEPEEPEILAEEMDLDILYEDRDIILINKPKGMAHCREDLSGINGVLRPGIVHRIDMDTTGVLIACKNDFAHTSIAQQLKVHSITRKYYAIVHGVIREEEGTVNAPIGRHPTDRKKMSINTKNGREAVTHYRVLQRFEKFTYVECQLETGRTHQIRVHMASIHHPLLGDTVYGPAKCPVSGLQGQTLHAGVLGFIHPRTGEYMEFSAPLPEYFQELLKKLK